MSTDSERRFLSLHAAVAAAEKLCDQNDPNHFSLHTIYISELTRDLLLLNKTRADLPVSRAFLTISVSNMITVVVDRERVIRIGVYLR